MSEQNIGKIEGTLAGIQKHMEQLDKAVYGNGQPGLEERETRAEERILKLSEAMNHMEEIVEEQKKSTLATVKEIRELIEAQKKNNDELKELIKSHIEDSKAHKQITLKDLVWNKTFPLYVIGVFIILNNLVGNVSLEQLGKAFLKWLGLEI